jgi:glycosyltransferase involved in cell wall biosynthesis
MLLSNFDLVHAHWELPSGIFGMILSKWQRKPFVLTSHGAFTDSFEVRPWIVRWLVRVILRNADAVITVGQYQKRKVETIANLAGERVHWIDMGVWLAQSPPRSSRARQLLSLPQDEKIIIFIGNLIQRKGADVLVKAAATLLQEGQRFRLIIGGQGEEKQNIVKAIDELKLQDVASVIGTVPPEDVFTWFSAADVCVVPSRTEPFGLVAIEAMSCGTAVIASDVGGLSETIRHGENGLLFPVGEHVALAKRLQKVLTNDDLRARVVEQGRQTAASHDMRLQADKVKAIYEELLSHRSQTRSQGDK